MFGIGGLQEILLLMLIIFVLSATGIWPQIIRGLRELRGDAPPPPPSGRPMGDHDLDMCYKILGVSTTSTWTEVEQAYKRKAKVHHPDRGGDEDAMRTLNEAYNLLKQRRRNG